VLGKKIFAGFEIRASFQRNDSTKEDHRVLVHDAFAAQEVGDFHDPEPSRNVDYLVLLKGARRLESMLADRDRNPGTERGENKQCQNCIADDYQRIPHPRRPSVWHGHGLRLKRSARRSWIDAFLCRRRRRQGICDFTVCGKSRRIGGRRNGPKRR
jgi:hypothetical protein